MRYLSLFLLIGSAHAQTCITIDNLRGQSAYSHQGYAFSEDGFSYALEFCYEGDYGKFDSNEGIFTRFGSNTWIWFNAIEETEVAEVWTFDFSARKALFVRTRGAAAVFPATAGAFIGDIR
jgi:hypothetical protein